MSLWRVAIEQKDGFENDVVNVVHYEVIGDPIEGDALALAQAIDFSSAATYASAMPAGLTGEILRVRSLVDPDLGVDHPISWVGARPGEGQAPQVCGVVQVLTGSFQRRFKGSMRVPAGTETDNVAGQPTVAWRNSMYAYAQSLREPGDTPYSGSALMVVYSRTYDDSRLVSDFSVGTLWGTLRSRKPGVGS